MDRKFETNVRFTNLPNIFGTYLLTQIRNEYFISNSVVVNDTNIAINNVVTIACCTSALRPHRHLIPALQTLQISNGIQLIKLNYEMNTKLWYRTNWMGWISRSRWSIKPPSSSASFHYHIEFEYDRVYTRILHSCSNYYLCFYNWLVSFTKTANAREQNKKKSSSHFWLNKNRRERKKKPTTTTTTNTRKN